MRGVLTDDIFLSQLIIKYSHYILIVHNIQQYLYAPVFDSHTVLVLQVLFTN